MEKVGVGKYSLRRQFIVGTVWVVLLVLGASAVSIYGGYRLQKWLLPDPNEAWMTAKVTYADGKVTESGQLIRLGDENDPGNSDQEWSYFVQGAWSEEEPDSGKDVRAKAEESETERAKTAKDADAEDGENIPDAANSVRLKEGGSDAASDLPEDEIVITEIHKDENGKISLTADEKKYFLDIYQDILPKNYVDAESIRFSVSKKEPDVSELTPKRRLVYRGISVSMVVLPVVYALLGVGLWGMYFYRRKLAPPLAELSQATEHIRRQDLDFSLHYESRDELGQLCRSFEQMRRALSDNSREMWAMVENRKKLQESVAHDLRNPTAILAGYVEHLQENVPLGKVSQEKLLHILANLASCVTRIGQYTESMRDISQMEDFQVTPVRIDLREMLEDMIRDFQVLAGQQIVLEAENAVMEKAADFDAQCFYRILENLFSNALRFAKEKITLRFAEEGGVLKAVVCDDGPGFSEKQIREKDVLFYSGSGGDHRGIGLTVCRILCRKLGGTFTIGNAPEGGACVEVRVMI